jgi:tripartite-type tricarboxylate transporter receptor subunit TctC
MAEAGYPEVNSQLWSGFFVPSGTPDIVVSKLTTELGKALADAGVRQSLAKMAVKPGGPTGEAFKKYIDADIKAYADVVTAAKLTFQ